MICAKSTSPAECFVHGLAVRLETISRNLRPFGNTGAEIVHERQSGFAIAGTDDVADDQLALGVQGRERPRITGIVGGGLRIRQGALLGIDEAPYRAGYTKVSALAVQGSGGRQTRWARQGGAVIGHHDEERRRA